MASKFFVTSMAATTFLLLLFSLLVTTTTTTTTTVPLQIDNLFSAVFATGNFQNWANLLSSNSLFLPKNFTLFIPPNPQINTTTLSIPNDPFPNMEHYFTQFDHHNIGKVEFTQEIDSYLLLLYHIVPQCLSFDNLVRFPFNNHLPTLLPGFTLLITKSNSSDLSCKLAIYGSCITHPEIFGNDSVFAHGVAFSFDYNKFGRKLNSSIGDSIDFGKWVASGFFPLDDDNNGDDDDDESDWEIWIDNDDVGHQIGDNNGEDHDHEISDDGDDHARKSDDHESGNGDDHECGDNGDDYESKSRSEEEEDDDDDEVSSECSYEKNEKLEKEMNDRMEEDVLIMIEWELEELIKIEERYEDDIWRYFLEVYNDYRDEVRSRCYCSDVDNGKYVLQMYDEDFYKLFLGDQIGNQPWF